MKYSILSLVTFFASFSAHASNFADPNLAALNDLQPQQIPRIEVELARPVAEHLRTTKITFAIQWEKTKCSANNGFDGAEFSEVRGGVCVFTAIVNGNRTAQIGAVISGNTLIGAHVISINGQ